MKKVLIIAISVCLTACRNPVDENRIMENSQENTSLMKLCADTAVTIVESKKSGRQIFSKYRKDNVTGLVSIYNDSLVFINDAIFAETAYQHFHFIDSLRIVFDIGQIVDDKTINRKYIFGFDGRSEKWLLEYAETKELAAEQAVYLFTNTFRHNFSLDDFSTASFGFSNDGSFRYTYKRNSYLDNIEIQVREMKSANVALFANIFTIDHAEEILRDYPVHKANVAGLNNIAYYLEQMSITMPAIVILETVIDSFPNRAVAYSNLYDALIKTNLKTKAEKLRTSLNQRESADK
jgi:hypothetical protein